MNFDGFSQKRKWLFPTLDDFFFLTTKITMVIIISWFQFGVLSKICKPTKKAEGN